MWQEVGYWKREKEVRRKGEKGEEGKEKMGWCCGTFHSSSVPNTHVEQLTAICNSRVRRYDSLFWPVLALHSQVHIHT